MTPLSTIPDHLEASRRAGTPAAVKHVAHELAALLRVDPDRVASILLRDRDEANELAGQARRPGYDVEHDHLDTRTTEALEALPTITTEEENIA